VLVLAGEALGASSVVLYGLCIVRRALPPSAQPPGEPAQPPCHVQARARPCVPFHAGILSGILSTVAGAGTLCMVWCQLARWCLARTCATAVAAARQACWGDQWVATRVVPLSWRPPASVTSVARWWVVSRRARAGAGAVLHRGAGHRGRVGVGCARRAGAATPWPASCGGPWVMRGSAVLLAPAAVAWRAANMRHTAGALLCADHGEPQASGHAPAGAGGLLKDGVAAG